MPINTKFSASTFQQCDGTNFSTAGIETSFKAGKGNISTYTGIGLTFDGNPSSAIVDFKGSMPYGKSMFSGGFRVRNNLNENGQSVQVRIQPATMTVPAGEKTNIYATPYAAAKVNYKTGETAISTGIFAGVSQKVGKANVFIEGQLYDVTKINKKTTSINAGVSIPL